MICSSSQYFSRKQKIRSCKNAFKNQILTLAIFVLICVVVGSIVQKNSAQTSYTFYYAQNKIVNKHTRGVFPPLQGTVADLYGCWRVGAVIGKDKTDVINFKSYGLCFEESGRIVVRKNIEGCKAKQSTKIYDWRVFSHNLFISQTKVTPVDQQNTPTPNKTTPTTAPPITPPTILNTPRPNLHEQSLSDPIPPQETSNSTQITQDPACQIENNQQLQYIHSATVWTLRQGSVFLITEPIINGNLSVGIIVMKRV